MGRTRSSDLFTATELSGGKPPALLAAEYEEKKMDKEKEDRVVKLAEKFGIDLATEEEGEGKVPPGDLKKLSPEHKVILAMYMSGYSQVNIAKSLQCHYLLVHKVLKSAPAQEILGKWKETIDLELDGLLPNVVDAIRQGLTAPDKKLKLLAVDRFIKLTGDNTGSNVTVNVVNSARDRFVGSLKELSAEVEDAEYTEIVDN